MKLGAMIILAALGGVAVMQPPHHDVQYSQTLAQAKMQAADETMPTPSLLHLFKDVLGEASTDVS